MKIAILTDSLPPRIDGVAKTYVNLFEFLERGNHLFKVFSPFMPENGASWADCVHCVPSIPFYLYPDYKISLPEKEKIQGILNDFDPDIVHISSPTLLGKAGLDYARSKGIPAVAAFHTNFASYFKYYGFAVFQKMAWTFLRQFYNQFDCTLAPSLNLLKKMERLGFENLTLWQRGIDTVLFHPQKYNPAIQKLLSPEGRPVLLYVGRLVKEKDLEDLVQLQYLLDRNKIESQLVIVGDGPMRDELKEKLPKALFMGYLQGEELAQIYASSEIFIFPSTTETFGNVILEANASGLPVIGVNEGGVADLIENGHNGFLANAHNSGELYTYVSHLLKNQNLRKTMGLRGRRKAGKFSWPAINSQLLKKYSQLSSGKIANRPLSI